MVRRALIGLALLTVLSAAARGSVAAPLMSPRVVVGPGIAEDTVRQVVRSRSNVVYVFAPDDTAQREGSGPGVIHAYRATTSGIPHAFAEADSTNRPTSTGADILYAPDVRLDRRGIAHMVYVDQAGDRLYYQTFSTVTNTWGLRRQLGGGAVSNPGFYATQDRVYRNWASYGLVLDRRDRPHVVYCSGNDVLSRTLGARGWSRPAVVARGRSPMHVQLATDAAWNIHATWLDDPLSESGSSAVMYARQLASGAWGAPQVVDHGSPNVLSNATDDQGPSIVATASGIPYVLYLRGTTDNAGKAISTAVVRLLRGGHWLDDSPPSTGYGITHSPQLYSRRNDIYLFLGHDVNIHWGYLVQRAGQRWSPYRLLDAASAMDGSVSVRWDPARDANPGVIDAVHHSEDERGDGSYLPQLYYQAVSP
jgi:hypothetical protein